MEALAHSLGKMSNGVDRCLRLLGAVFVVIMVMTICLQVVARYGFSAPPAWTEEAARYAMVWVGLLGASVSFKAGFDPKLLHVPSHFSTRLRVAAAVIRGVAILIFLCPILFYCFYGPGMNPMRSFLSRSLITEAESFDMPMIFVAITVPVFICAIFLHGLAHIAQAVNHHLTATEEHS